MADTFLSEDSGSSGVLNAPRAAPARALDTGASWLALPWETLGAMIQGKSSIDLSAMPVRNREEAESLVYNYGFDLGLPEDLAEMEGYFIEAVNFIEHRLLNPAIDWVAHGEPSAPAATIPSAVTGPRDVIALILMAADTAHPHRFWACALLKVIHTLVYIQSSPLYKYHGQAAEAILARFREILRHETGKPGGEGSISLLGRNGRQLKLYGFEAKRQKPRESILIKLLCKKEHVAENVWDLVGVRLITFHPAEAILAVDILREQKVVLFPNVIPSRSRNTLIEFEHFKEKYEAKLAEFQAGRCPAGDVAALFNTDEYAIPLSTHFDHNPLSAQGYRSLHITCRQLLRIRQPGGVAETRFAFPYELQIMDREGYLESRLGHGAHASYKQRQLFAARRRVLGPLLKP